MKSRVRCCFQPWWHICEWTGKYASLLDIEFVTGFTKFGAIGWLKCFVWPHDLKCLEGCEGQNAKLHRVLLRNHTPANRLGRRQHKKYEDYMVL
jgi:hypothetical protein